VESCGIVDDLMKGETGKKKGQATINKNSIEQLIKGHYVQSCELYTNNHKTSPKI
jgi:hypothetical protein